MIGLSWQADGTKLSWLEVVLVMMVISREVLRDDQIPHYHDHHHQPHDGDDGDLPSRPLRWLHRAAAIQQCLQALWAPASSKLALHHLSLMTVTTCTFSLTSTLR